MNAKSTLFKREVAISGTKELVLKEIKRTIRTKLPFEGEDGDSKEFQCFYQRILDERTPEAEEESEKRLEEMRQYIRGLGPEERDSVLFVIEACIQKPDEELVSDAIEYAFTMQEEWPETRQALCEILEERLVGASEMLACEVSAVLVRICFEECDIARILRLLEGGNFGVVSDILFRLELEPGKVDPAVFYPSLIDLFINTKDETFGEMLLEYLIEAADRDSRLIEYIRKSGTITEIAGKMLESKIEKD